MNITRVTMVWTGGSGVQGGLLLFNDRLQVGSDSRSWINVPAGEWTLWDSPVVATRAMINLMDTTKGGHRVRFYDNGGKFWETVLPTVPVQGWGCGVDLPSVGDKLAPIAARVSAVSRRK